MQDKTISKLIQENRRIALAQNLECLPENIIPSPHSDKIFDVGAREYLVVTEQEANCIIAEQVENELWAFHPEWLVRHTLLRNNEKFAPADYEAILQAFSAIQQHFMETCNPMLRGLIEATCGMLLFIEEAIAHNGRGHFLAPCDEDEEKQGDFYIYRMN